MGSFCIARYKHSYSISVVQDGQVRHIRVIADPGGGYKINKADEAAEGIEELIIQKMGEKIKSKLAGGQAKETELLKFPHYPQDDEEDALDMGSLMSGR